VVNIILWMLGKVDAIIEKCYHECNLVL
jgi:hypothetical protein